MTGQTVTADLRTERQETLATDATCTVSLYDIDHALKWLERTTEDDVTHAVRRCLTVRDCLCHDKRDRIGWQVTIEQA